MGGFGSGRPTGSGRAKVEVCRSIDVSEAAGCSEWLREIISDVRRQMI